MAPLKIQDLNGFWGLKSVKSALSIHAAYPLGSQGGDNKDEDYFACERFLLYIFLKKFCKQQIMVSVSSLKEVSE